MRNLEQKRAEHALKMASGIDGGVGKGDPKGVVKKVPSQVIQCGMLASMAFAVEKGAGYADVYKAFIDYSDEIQSKDLEGAIKELCAMSSNELRMITTEFMAYLSYLRRFV